MMYKVSKNDLINLNYSYFKKIIGNHPEFFSCPGKEHYRLLSYFSTLFDNSNIIDIGTHEGNSALALSYNNSNKIYTFDIVDNRNPSIKNIDNIYFNMKNLFENNIFHEWKEIILSAPFIFLDVDPHNGKMEIKFIEMLKDINYNGFIICDDIWYFKDMRNNFWYNIDDKFKYDLTNIGHWSGTGIITFNENIQFEKYNVSNWTLVTAYFNLTKYHDASNEIKTRNIDYYLSHSLSTLSLPHNMVIYCDKESVDYIKKLRPNYLEKKTLYVIRDFNSFKFEKNGLLLDECFENYREKIIENRSNNTYNFDNRNTASYYLFCMSRYIMLKEVIKLNPFGSTHFCWINFCIERMGYKNLIRLDESLSVNREKFSTCYIDYISENLINDVKEYFRWGRCSMCSGFFTGNSEYMYKVCDLIENKFLEYLDKGYGHADEQLFSPVYFQNPNLFEHYYGDYHEMITNYHYIYDAASKPINIFIHRSFEQKDYKKCYEACKFVYNSWCNDKCDINQKDIYTLFYYYMFCKKILKDF